MASQRHKRGGGVNLWRMFEERARAQPEAIALIFGDRRMTYGELLAQAERVCGGLASFGIQPGDRFAIVLRNSPEFVILSLALSRLGAVSVPMNFLLKSAELAYIFQNSGARGVLTSNLFLAEALSAASGIPGFGIFVTEDSPADALARSFSTLLEKESQAKPEISKENLATLIYTAGTTGKPKGAMLSHKNLLANVASCQAAFQMSDSDVFLCLLPMFHSFSWTTCVLLPLSLGARIVIVPTLQPFEPVIRAIWKHKVTLFVGVPPIYAALTSRLKGLKLWIVRLLNPVRVCVSGANGLPQKVLEDFERAFRVPLLEGYGLTETSPVVSVNPLHGKRKIKSVGPPIPGVQVRILDESEEPLPIGEVGEICVKGDNVMKGYWENPEATKEVFTEEGWFKTGDLGSLDEEGYLFIADRKKDLIKVKGLNVYPQEVEEILLRHPAVAEAAVVGIANESGDEMVKGFVVLKPESQSSTLTADLRQAERSEILAFARERLASYKAPRQIEILLELPKNALQKILKRELRLRR